MKLCWIGGIIPYFLRCHYCTVFNFYKAPSEIAHTPYIFIGASEVAQCVENKSANIDFATSFDFELFRDLSHFSVAQYRVVRNLESIHR